MDTNTYLKHTFSLSNTPDWVCPTCQKGQLNIVADKFTSQQTASSLAHKERGDYSHEDVDYVFIGLLKCSNPKCADLVSFTGIGGVEQYYNQDDYGVPDVIYEDYFIPKYFVPSLKLFKISSKCPSEVRTQIVQAFDLYWCDLAACANKIRIAIEMIMNHFKIRKTHKDKKGKTKLNYLDSRIHAFGSKYPKLKDHLLAIKWIGNSGSHVGKLERVDLIDAFSLLEYCIEQLFENREKELVKISKEVNKAKKPRHATRKLF